MIAEGKMSLSRVLIDIYKGEYEVRREVNRKILNEG